MPDDREPKRFTLTRKEIEEIIKQLEEMEGQEVVEGENLNRGADLAAAGESWFIAYRT